MVETLRDFKIKMPEDMIEEWRRMIVENAIIVVPLEKIDVVTDVNDNKFFEAACTGGADYIVSQDKQVLKVTEHKNIKTIHPKEFVKLI